MALTWIDWLGLVLLAALLEGAILVFLRIQFYLNDPLRKERNEQWFAAFEKQMRQRYTDPRLRWRMEGMGRLFDRSDRRP
jgi:hypothetical protein